MFRPASILPIAIAVGVAFGQAVPELRLPRLNGDRSTASQRASNLTLEDAVSRYQNPHEAAVAAFQEAYKAAALQHNRARAMGLLLISLKRDPNFGKALFDMAELCEQEQTWADALAFYRQTQQSDADPALAALAGQQITRVEEIARLESTPAGQKQRQYNIQLLAAVPKIKDPAVGLDDAAKLVKLDASRWEGVALTGILQAALGRYSDSYHSLEQAGGLAPAQRRAQIQSAADVARREASFLDSVRAADEAWDKKQFDVAAKSYSTAWQDNPADTKVGMQAATGYLLADQVPPAVAILSQLRGAQGDAGVKAAAMLKELAAVSDDAKRASANAPAAAAPPSIEASAAERIRTTVGELTTPQMELAARSAPPLVDDKTMIVPVPDEEITSAGSDLMLLSTQSVFTLYQQKAAAQAPPPAAAAPDLGQPGAPSMPAAPPAAQTPPPLPLPAAPESGRPSPPGRQAEPPPAAAARTLPPSATRGNERTVDVSSLPPGAVAIFDDNPTVTCAAPCQISLTAGRHTLVATLAGYRMAKKIVQVEEKKATSVMIEMVAKQGFVTVESATPGSPVFLNGRNTGRLTPATLPLNEGEYEVAVEVDGSLKTQKTTVKDGDFLKVSLK